MMLKRLAFVFCIICLVIISSCVENPTSFRFKNDSSATVKITLSEPYGYTLTGEGTKKIANPRTDPFTVSGKSSEIVYVKASDVDFTWTTTNISDYPKVNCKVNGSAAVFSDNITNDDKDN